MTDSPAVRFYQPGDRERVFAFAREVYAPDDASRVIRQWDWKYTHSPFTLPEGPDVVVMHAGDRIIGLSAGFRLQMWMGGIECAGDGLGTWVVDRNYRDQNLWAKLKARRPGTPPVQFGWTRLPNYVSMRQNRPTDPLRPFLRILDAGPLLTHFTHLRALGSMTSAVGAARRSVIARARRTNANVVRLDSFDDRADGLWERARRSDRAMIVREHRYLNWRYCARPDATYTIFGLERGRELGGFLVARTLTYLGMRWGYLVDFLAPDDSSNALATLIDAALEDFRDSGVAAVTCYATDPAARSALIRRGFFIAPQRKPIRFVRWTAPRRADLTPFRDVRRWYLTMGDGDLEMTP